MKWFYNHNNGIVIAAVVIIVSFLIARTFSVPIKRE